jgi:hypothetical protein
VGLRLDWLMPTFTQIRDCRHQAQKHVFFYFKRQPYRALPLLIYSIPYPFYKSVPYTTAHCFFFVNQFWVRFHKLSSVGFGLLVTDTPSSAPVITWSTLYFTTRGRNCRLHGRTHRNGNQHWFDPACRYAPIPDILHIDSITIKGS